jgi:hypothetical protein
LNHLSQLLKLEMVKSRQPFANVMVAHDWVAISAWTWVVQRNASIPHFMFNPPKAQLSSSSSQFGNIARAITVLCPSDICVSSKSGCGACLPAFTGSSISSSLSNHPGATLRFSASSASLTLSSYFFDGLLRSCILRTWPCSASHDAIMSS